jgi:Outer membrane protein beta-barrel family/CarboxypepD_reg-like domain
MKKLLLLFSLFLLFTPVFSQNPNRINIKGIVADTSGETLPLATVMLLNPKDSALINFTRGDDKGAFEFKNVKNQAYLLKISYVSYLPLQKNIEPSATPVLDLGSVIVKPITKELLEVVIKTARAPLSIRGDTIEYNAASFKVPPGSTVEDLLRRLPGIEVDADGNIKAQGRDVKKLYVDGKTFFGDDPKAATKNLGAETISKVQVFNEKSEQSKLTGVDDGKKEKAMNLELKEEYKKGKFGKVTAGLGTEDRWALRGNFNKFNAKEQFSVIGFANNINQTGVNWEDYGEFKGQNSFNNNDNGDFGFGGGGNYWYFNSENTPFFNNFDGRGFTKNHGAGTNYNFDNKKLKFSSSYFYNQTNLALDQFGLRQTFLDGSTFSNTDTLNQNNFRSNHSLNTRLEREFDSTKTLIIKADGRFSQTDVRNTQSQLFQKASGNNFLQLNNLDNQNSWRLVSSAIYRNRFKKKGRSIAGSVGYNNSNSDGTENLNTINRFFAATTFTDQIRQLNNNQNATQQIKSSLLYTDAWAKKWFWETFYNVSNTQNDIRRQVKNPTRNEERVDSLSVFYDNQIFYNRIGTSIRYSHEGANIMVGVAGQSIRLDGKYSIDRETPLLATPLSRTFNNVTPNVDINWELPNNNWISAGYNYSIKAPEIADLQPVRNINNPIFRNEGNPNLVPERSHNISMNYNKWNPATFASIGFWGEYSMIENPIVYSQTIENIPNLGIRTTTRPDNMTQQGRRVNGNFWLNFPIVKTKLTANGNGGINYNRDPAFVNSVLNTTNNFGYNGQVGLNFTPDPKFIMDASINLRNNDIKYSIQKEQNQKIRNITARIATKWQFAKKTFFESSFDYSQYKNDRFDFDQTIPIWNASIRHLFLKENRLEMRLAAFDLLNRRVSINQMGTQNFVSRTEAITLARYFMLSATYNLKGHEAKLKKNNWM